MVDMKRGSAIDLLEADWLPEVGGEEPVVSRSGY